VRGGKIIDKKVWEQAVARPREVRRGNRRREDFHAWKRLVSPRLITSDG
jgi:hypothetical protein